MFKYEILGRKQNIILKSIFIDDGITHPLETIKCKDNKEAIKKIKELILKED